MKSNKSGLIFSIKRFEINDGVGVRTTVFLKGCPLECLWCHNPEGLSKKQEIGVFSQKCIGCMDCANECECHLFTDSGRVFLRDKCKGCMKCADLCVSGAIVEYGKKYSAEEVLFEVLKDREIYEKTGGGITLSGGEPMLQPDFVLELLKLAKNENLNTALDTCGYAKWENYEKVLPFVDMVLYDLKAFDPNLHKTLTGKDNALILDNLKKISQTKTKIAVRIPLIPTLNDGEIKKIGEFLSQLENIVEVKVLPYHNYSSNKYQSLNKSYLLDEIVPPNDEEIKLAIKTLKSYNINAVDGRK
ncbi:MAG: glycyl-radical enzyme activating protein [Ruminococcaceae bacterium]|nr:glycyl-radical enzyme activating protein [Oscillospiraceae bacterium]